MFENAAKAYATTHGSSKLKQVPAVTSNLESTSTVAGDSLVLQEDPSVKPSNKQEQKTIYNGVCELLICDEAHKLKNADSGLSKSLGTLPVRKRVLLSGTPMQNELEEFFNMVNFCNPMVLGTVVDFRKR